MNADQLYKLVTLSAESAESAILENRKKNTYGYG